MILYPHPETGQSVVTHSMIKAFKRCPKSMQYKYVERLKPKVVGAALHRGKWVHALLEVHYKGGDWRAEHLNWCREYGKLFDEEKARLGDLPTDIEHLMTSYFWHYKNDRDWTVLETELTIETEFPDGTLFRCRVDNLVETPFGIYLVDHKTHRQLPGHDFRLRDTQSPLYIWAARRTGIPVVGFIWNYIRATTPSHWRFKRDGNLYARIGDTDFPTALRDLKNAGKDPKDPLFAERLATLKRVRYEHGGMQTSPFFLRHMMDKNDEMIKQSVREAIHTTKRMSKYPFEKTAYVERVPDRACDWCDYRAICTTELTGGNADFLRRKQFKEEDPMSYYEDRKEFSDA